MIKVPELKEYDVFEQRDGGFLPLGQVVAYNSDEAIELSRGRTRWPVVQEKWRDTSINRYS